MVANPILYCPIRGQQKIRTKSKDGLTFSEEKRRIDCISHLIQLGYPEDNLKAERVLVRFGHGGRNSFRSDVVAFDSPVSALPDKDLENLREHIQIICEVKRDNKDAEKAKKQQVKSAMGFLPNFDALGLYWDDIEQTVFYRELKGSRQILREAPITYLPKYGDTFSIHKLRYRDLRVARDVIGRFRRLENAIHPHVADVSTRYEILLQLLLVKIFDEGANEITNDYMIMQDFTLIRIPDHELVELLDDTLQKSLNIYQRYLPKNLSRKFAIPAEALREASRHLAPLNLLRANPENMQDFYMFFAKQLYKWDLAQYFTPYEVVDFIVRLVNPKYGETIKDPACGSADFLISALRQGVSIDSNIGDRIYGADNSENAVQISVLNMLLNGDGKSNIYLEDSLVEIDKSVDSYSIMLCNPPFGVKITEKRQKVLRKYDLGRNYPYQQTGILFAELVVRSAQPRGRVAIILPNGYLGNRSERYHEFRYWLLRHMRIAAIIGFPRFTFKKSGADVSASVLVMEKRVTPLQSVQESEDYPVHVNLLESVGWEIGNKTARRVHKRDPETGALILDDSNEPLLDADFDSVLREICASPVAAAFQWIPRSESSKNQKQDGWAISFGDIIKDDSLIIDPKRWCKKYKELKAKLQQAPHVLFDEICEILPENWSGKKSAKQYRYIEVGDVHQSTYEGKTLRGWELPSRAKHLAQPGDIFVASVWSSVEKWFICGPEAEDEPTVVTNGFYRLKLKPGKEDLLIDLVLSLSSEHYRVQMRALATGSDGLAEISVEDLKGVIIPLIFDRQIRLDVQKYIDGMLTAGKISRLSSGVLASEKLPAGLSIPERRSRFAQV